MKKQLKVIVGLWSMLFSSAYATSLVSLDSPHGGELLASSITSGYAKPFLSEVRYFTYQQNRTFCGIATAVIVLNTLQVAPPKDTKFLPYGLFTQDNLFVPAITQKTMLSVKELQHGLSLSQESKLLNSFEEVKATAYFANQVTESQMRTIFINTLKDNKQLLIVNILRSQMNENGGGHFSPVVAYNPKEDAVLFMDVASFRYAPVWVPIHVLYNAMHTKDGDNYRGFIIVQKQ